MSDGVTRNVRPVLPGVPGRPAGIGNVRNYFSVAELNAFEMKKFSL